MRIRKAVPGDVCRVAEILVFNNRLNFFPIFRDEEYSFVEMNVFSVAQSYRDDPKKLNQTWLCDDNGIVKGFVQIDGEEGVRLYVEPGFQSAGVGGHLLDYAVAQGANRLWALEKNVRGIAFYRRHGFLPTGEKTFEEGTAEYLVRLALEPNFR